MFDQCGEIAAIRKSKKNFCHIRFGEEFMVDKAIYLSGEAPPPPASGHRGRHLGDVPLLITPHADGDELSAPRW